MKNLNVSYQILCLQSYKIVFGLDIPTHTINIIRSTKGWNTNKKMISKYQVQNANMLILIHIHIFLNFVK